MSEQRGYEARNENMPNGQMPTRQRPERDAGAGEESVAAALEVLRTVRAPRGMEARIVAAVRTREAEVAGLRAQAPWSRWLRVFNGSSAFRRGGSSGLSETFAWRGGRSRGLVPVWAGAVAAVAVVTAGMLIVGGRGRDGGVAIKVGGPSVFSQADAELSAGGAPSGSSGSRGVTGMERRAGLPSATGPENIHVSSPVTQQGALRKHATKNITNYHGDVLQSVHTLEDGPRRPDGEVAAVSYPAPTAPLTQQERLLLRILHRGDPEEWAMLDPVVQAKRDALEKAEVQSFFDESSRRAAAQNPTAPDSTESLPGGESK